MTKNKTALGILFTIICNVIFGFSYIFTKNITNTVSPLTLLSWRFILAFIVLSVLALFGVFKVNFKGKAVMPLFLIALFHPVLYFIGETIGIRLTTASESSSIASCIPIITMVCSRLILKEVSSRQQILGVSITIAGVLVAVVSKGMDATFNALGYIMIFLSLVSYSLYSVFAQKTVQFTDMEKTYVMIGLSAAVFTFAALVNHAANGTMKQYLSLPFTNTAFLTAILYLGIGSSILAFFLCNKAISYIGTNKTSSFVGLGTVVSITAGVLILNERFTIYQIIGTVLILAGVYAANGKFRLSLRSGKNL